jgi:S1-C subfamily serine protease
MDNSSLRRVTALSQHLAASHRSPTVLSSVVKIFTTSVAPSYASPWQQQREQKSTGTGFAIDLTNIISSKLQSYQLLIMTNNHVIRNATTVRVLRHGMPGKYTGKILCASPECDLALVAVEDEDFWQSVKPLRFAFGSDLHHAGNGEILPVLGSRVTAVGYPIGGDNISVTRGVVSRIDLMDYTSVNPAGKLLVVQIDAAINPGNSGGPVTNSDQDCVGVAFAGITRGNSIGYIIPLPIVRMFVMNAFDYLSNNLIHATTPFPRLTSLGLGLQSTESPALRKHYQLTGASGSIDERLGMLVLRVATSSPCDKLVHVGDIITSIAGSPVSEDGTVEVRAGSRVSLLYSVCMRRPGESFSIGFVRDGKNMNVSVVAHPVPRLVPRMHGVDATPSYLVVGGLVFVTLTLPWIRSARGAMGQGTVAALLTHAEANLEEKDQGVVVLSRVLSHDVNFGYDSFAGQVLKTFQGKKVTSLQHLALMLGMISAVGTSSSTPIGAYSFENNELFSFSFESQRVILLDRNKCRRAETEILERQGIPKPFML